MDHSSLAFFLDPMSRIPVFLWVFRGLGILVYVGKYTENVHEDAEHVRKE